MQSMIASQQQLIRRSINTSYNSINNSNNNNNITNSNSSNSSNSNNSNNVNKSNGEKSDQLIDCLNPDNNETINKEEPNLTTSCQSLNVQPVVDSMTDSTQTIGTDLNSSGSDVKKSGEKSQTKKKRSNNSWLNILNPTYKTRHEEFKRLFYGLVPNNERLVVDYSCALQKEILVHGRLYLSLNYISFHANIFKWETSLVIKCEDITSLTKANTARVIPNAIQVVTTSGERYFFTSFGARDKTYVMLFRIWQNALLNQPMSSAQLWQWVHYSYGEDLGLTSDDDEEYYSDNLVHTLSDQPRVKGQHNSDSSNSIEPDLMAGPEVYEDCVDTKCVSSQCKCGTHEGKLIMDETIPVTVDRAFELIFTDNKFIHNLHKSRRTYDLCVTQWEDSSNEKVRQLTYTVALNHALVKSAKTIENQRILEDREESTPGKYYTIKSEADNEGIPYCDTFSNHSLWCLTQESEDVTRIKVHARVVYKKNNWALGLMKPMIEKSSIQGITDFCADLSKQLPNWVKMERNLGINDIKINAKNIDYISADLSLSPINDSTIPDVSQMSNPTPDSTQLYSFLTNIFSISDALIIKIILLTLILTIILNIIILSHIWEIESKTDFSSKSLDTQQIIKNPIYLKQFIDNSIEMIRTIESNLQEMKNKLNDEL